MVHLNRKPSSPSRDPVEIFRVFSLDGGKIKRKRPFKGRFVNELEYGAPPTLRLHNQRLKVTCALLLQGNEGLGRRRTPIMEHRDGVELE